MAKEEQKIRVAAREMEREERRTEKDKAKNTVTAGSSSQTQSDAKAQLWTVKYAPKTLKEICGNKSQVEKLQRWLGDWCVRRAIHILG